ncbi:MAG TPA: serine protease [Candidatus Melainabacteria bacterium]|nr:serine protease [Candidatus Melainabacteria bacterium]
MSENNHPGDQSAQRRRDVAENDATRVEQTARQAFQQEATDLRGRTCSIQPEQGMVPTLNPGQRTAGCNYESLAAIAERTGVLEVGDIWNEMTRSSVHIRLRDERGGRATGSGVVIGEHNNQCVVLTAAHVSSPNQFFPGGASEVTSRGVVMPNGRTYPAEVRFRDVRTDRAVMTVRTGDDTSAICHPARFAEDTSRRGPAFVGGFPLGSRSQYLSPGESLGIRRTLVQPGSSERNPREIFLIAQTHAGNSGAQIRNARNEVFGILSREHLPHEDRRPTNVISVAQPVSARQVENYMRILRSQR